MTAPASTPQMRRVALSGLLGTTIEYYDFIVYGTLAALAFNRLFFPELDPLAGTVASFGTFAAGYVARPLGGALFGHFGDRLSRKSVLLLTMSLMGVASFLVGCLPTYRTVGVWAPVLLVALRTVQGLAVGGEWGGAVLMTAEHADARRRGMWSSLTVSGGPFGSVLSTLTVLAVRALPDEKFYAWGWRVPFWLSIVLLGVGMFVRLRVAESPVFARLKASGPAATSRLPLVEVLRRPGTLARAVGLGIGTLAMQSLWSTFVLSYASRSGYDDSLTLTGLAVGSALQLVTVPWTAALSDRHGRRPVMLAATAGTVVLAFPLFWMIDSGSAVLLLIAVIVGRALVQAATYGPLAALLTESFDTRTRYTGASLGYQLASLLAGFAPLIAGSLLGAGGSGLVALFVIVLHLLSGAAAWRSRESRGSELAGARAADTGPAADGADAGATADAADAPSVRRGPGQASVGRDDRVG